MARGHKTGGRQKGTPNRLTTEVKDMVLTALQNKGGVKYLEGQAAANPAAFMTLIGKIIPLQLNAEHSVTVGDRDEMLAEAHAEVCEIFGKPYLAVNNGQ